MEDDWINPSRYTNVAILVEMYNEILTLSSELIIFLLKTRELQLVRENYS